MEAQIGISESIIQETLAPICERLGTCNYLIHHNGFVALSSRHIEHYQLMEMVGLSPCETDSSICKKGTVSIKNGVVQSAHYDNGQDYDDGSALQQAILQGYQLWVPEVY